MKTLQLTEQDKQKLASWGYHQSDIDAINRALDSMQYSTSTGKQVSWLTAKRIVGSEQFLGSIARATFHSSAAAQGTSTVYFEYSN